jgi:hypothetical protein
MTTSHPTEVAEFLAEIAARRAAVDELHAKADAAEAEFRDWAIREWQAGRADPFAGDRQRLGGGQLVADAIGVSKSRLYQMLDDIRSADPT